MHLVCYYPYWLLFAYFFVLLTLAMLFFFVKFENQWWVGASEASPCFRWSHSCTYSCWVLLGFRCLVYKSNNYSCFDHIGFIGWCPVSGWWVFWNGHIVSSFSKLFYVQWISLGAISLSILHIVHHHICICKWSGILCFWTCSCSVGLVGVELLVFWLLLWYCRQRI